jgi:hypothetical protein
MANGSDGGWSAGRAALAIAGGCFVLMLLCCTGTYFSNRDAIDEAFAFLGETAEFGQQFVAGTQHFDDHFEETFGGGGTWRIDAMGNDNAGLLIGVDGDLADADIEALQDAAWQLWGESFPDGAMPIVSIGIGTAGELQGGGDTAHQGKVHDWRDHSVDIATLIERTGREAPPVARVLVRAEELERRSRDEAGPSDRDQAIETDAEVEVIEDE